MTPKSFICLLLLLECLNAAEAVFNLTSAHCYNPREDSLVNLYSEWPAFSKDGSDGYCYDAHDDGYQVGQSFLTCSGCMKFTCTSRPCVDRDGSLFKMFWILESIGSECCQSCDGTIVPPNKVVTTAQMGGRCQIREVAICKTSIEELTDGSIEVSYESDLCCSDELGWSKLDEGKLEPETCSRRTCSKGSPAHWDSKIVYSGHCNCCVYKGMMVADGGSVKLASGELGRCCKGEIGVSAEKDPGGTTEPHTTTSRKRNSEQTTRRSKISTTRTTTTSETIAIATIMTATATTATTATATTATITTATDTTATATTATATTATDMTATATTETATTATATLETTSIKVTTTPTTTTTTKSTTTTSTTTRPTSTTATTTKTTTTTTTTTKTTRTTSTTTTTTTTTTETSAKSTTTTLTNTTKADSTRMKRTTTTLIPATVQSGHTLLRKIVVDTTTCEGCSAGSLVIHVWGADDAVVVHDCTTTPLRVTGVGKQGFERELGEYTKTHGCREAPLDARVSDGTIEWVGEGLLKADDICFEWLDEKKFPLDCKIYGNVIASCKTNRDYPGLKCPTS